MPSLRTTAAVAIAWSIAFAATALLAGTPAPRPDGPVAYISNSSTNTVSVIDVETMIPVAAQINVGQQPRGSALTPDGKLLLVCNRSDDTISVVDTETLTELTTIPITGSAPNDIAVHPDGSKAYVACRNSDSVCVIDLGTNTESANVPQPVGSAGPKGIAITPDGSRCYTANSDSSTVDVFFTGTDSFLGTPIPTSTSSRDIRISTNGATAIAVGNEPIFIATATNTVIATGLPSVSNTQRHVDVAGDRAFVTVGFLPSTSTSALAVFDLDPFSLVDTIPIATTGIEGVAVHPDGKTAWVSVRTGTLLQKIDLVTKTLGATAPVDIGPRHVTLFAPVRNVPPPNTIRSFLLPKKLAVTVGARKKKAPGVAAKGFFDTGPGDVDFTAAAKVTIGPRVIDVPGLTPIKNGKQFMYDEQNLSLTVTPSRIGTSKGKFKLSLAEDLAGEVDLNGQFTISYVGGGIDATGTVVLQDGAFKFGRTPGTLIAPEIDIRKAKANLPGVGKHKFKFVAGLAGDGSLPPQPPDLFVAFGDIFNADLPAAVLTQKGKNFVLGAQVQGGIQAVTFSPAKERISVRGGNTDIGQVPVGPFPLLLIVKQDGETDVRAVLVRAVRTKKQLKY